MGGTNMIEVLKQAYQLLLTEPHAPTVCDQLEVIFRRAIAELESQEPVGEVGWLANVPNTIREVYWKKGSPPIGTKLYTHPPQRTEPVDYEKLAALGWQAIECGICGGGAMGYPQRTEQEPVAYDKTEINFFVQDLYDKKMQEGKHGHYETMFHVVHQAIKRATPPQRTWVGLTEDEKSELWEISRAALPRYATYASLVEAKLKEKNNA